MPIRPPTRPSNPAPHETARRRRPVLFWLAALATAAAGLGQPDPCEAVDPFYERRHEEGVLAHELGDYPRAIQELRVACFGMLDEPALLAECLAHLALAQGALGDREAFEQTFRRIVEVERRFGAYSAAALDGEKRRRLEERLREWIDAERLEARLGIAPRADDPPVAGRPPDPAPAPESEPPGDAQEVPAVEPPDDGSGVSQVEPPLPAAPHPGADDATDVESRMATARELLASGENRDALRATFEGLRDLVDRFPHHRELRDLAAEVAYRLRLWQETVEVSLGDGGDGPDRPDRQFYLAVALYESGDRAAARLMLERCLSQIEQTAFVRDYAARIRGSGG